MAGDFALRGRLTLDSKQFTTSTKKVTADTKKMGDEGAKSFDKLGTAGKVAFAAMVAAAGAWLKTGVDLAIAAEETVSKFNTVTGASGALADQLVENANQYGATASEIKGLVGNLAAVAQGFGFAEAESVNLAVSSVELAGDLASFNNIAGGAAEVSEILTAAYAGEREQLKRLGIVITQADVDQQALIETNKETAKELTAAEKAAATYTLVVERAGKAVGDLNRTSESTANRQRAVAAAFREVQEEAGQKLIPVVDRFLEIGTAALPAFADVLVTIAGLIADFVEGVVFVGETLAELPGPVKIAVTAIGGLKVALLAISANPVVAGLAIVAAGVTFIGNQAGGQTEKVEALTQKLIELNDTIDATDVTEFLTDDDIREFEEAGISIEEIVVAVNEGGEAFLELGTRIEDSNRWAILGSRVIPGLKQTLIDLRTASLNSAEGLEEQADAAATAAKEAQNAALAAAYADDTVSDWTNQLDLATAAQTALTAALVEFIDEQRALADPVFAAIKATDELAEAQKALTESEVEFGAGSEEAVDAALAVVDAQLSLEEAQAELAASGESAVETFRNLGDRAELTGTQLQGVTGEVRDAEEAADDFAGNYAADFSADTTAAERALLEWQEQAATEITATIDAIVNVTAVSTGVGVRGFAGGTRNAPAGIAIVGEDGPELVDFRGGETV